MSATPRAPDGSPLPSRDASRREWNRRKMAAERQVVSGGSGRGGGGSGGGNSSGGSAAGLEENKENEKPKPGGLGDSLGLESILPARRGLGRA